MTDTIQAVSRSLSADIATLNTISHNIANSNTPGFREKVKVVFASCGSRENPGNIRTNHEALNSIGLKNTAYVSPDTAHEFQTWRRSLREFAPLLFKE